MFKDENKTNEIMPGQIMVYTGNPSRIGPSSAVGINYPIPGSKVRILQKCRMYKDHYILEGYEGLLFGKFRSVHSDFLKPEFIKDAVFILKNITLKNNQL